MTFLRPKVIITVSTIIVLLLLVSLAQEMNRRLQIQREVQNLERQVREMERSVIELENLNTYFGTDDFKERLAREKLNYQSPGEKVVLLPQNGISNADIESASTETDSSSILERWWRMFFVDPQN